MSTKSKRQGGQPKTVTLYGHPYKQYPVETRSTFLTKHVLTPREIADVRNAAQKAALAAVSDWLKANLGVEVTADVKEYVRAIAPVTGRLNS